MKSLAIPVIALVVVGITAPAQAHTITPKTCTAMETATYTSGTYFVHHATYDTVGPISKPYIVKLCIQYLSDVKKWSVDQ